ncbi:type II toxin-antitoxin system VapC family toxin [Acidisphaera sp. L21]|uniref:type II toxin-antitoxin system VapC family toxin n=1 Tax=Acidisphaera sp. L21 TaxID=1641851 RepID=UPI00131B78F4|nr:type II toxin-antitoxin system VapC family toxin [Acidisphaera sp. L21]
MTVKVVDASAIAALCFAEPEQASIVRALRGFELAAPALIDFELANICWKRSRRDSTHAAQYRAQLRTRTALPIAIHDVMFEDVLDLAVRTGLTAYDASYLWLARHLGAELVTLDKRLAAVSAA